MQFNVGLAYCIYSVLVLLALNGYSDYLAAASAVVYYILSRSLAGHYHLRKQLAKGTIKADFRPLRTQTLSMYFFEIGFIMFHVSACLINQLWFISSLQLLIIYVTYHLRETKIEINSYRN